MFKTQRFVEYYTIFLLMLLAYDLKTFPRAMIKIIETLAEFFHK